MTDMVAAAKPTAPKAVTTKHLAYELAEQHQLTKTQALEMTEELIGIPITGEQIQIKASKKVAFRATKELKEAV
jgi:DNA-binding protein HU-beta